MRNQIIAILVVLLVAGGAGAGAEDEVFGAGEHCVAYRTVKDMWFFVDTPIVGKSCEVTAALEEGSAGRGAQLSVAVPIESLDSGNFMRDHAVADLLGVETQPDLRFFAGPLDAEALRPGVAQRHFVLEGVLAFGGRDFAVTMPIDLVRREGRLQAQGRLATTFEAFGVEVPTVAAGLVARPHEEVEILFQLDLDRVAGLVPWAQEHGLQPVPTENPPGVSPEP